jgi:Ricin-type beta-trefoil lectin domain/Glycosyl hydrolases family 18
MIRPASYAALAAMIGAATAVLTASAATPAYAAATPLPAHVFAPYFETYNGDNPVTLSQESGAKYLTFAFIQTASSGSCTAYWDGDTSQPLTSANFGSDISSIQSSGGNVIPSFGGESADNSGTDIADSCTSVNSIAQVYENVITTYNVPRIDLDIEGDSLTNTAGIDRRNEAVAQTESWAAANGRSIQFSYTMPGTPTGMDSQEQSIIANAISVGASVSVVNLMTFDYYIGTQQEMATDTESAGADLHSQLQSLYPSDSSAQLWDMIGVTEMPGIDDFGSPETFTEADAGTVLNWAKSNGVSTVSFWALQRDNGGCPGTGGSDSCSGISQPTWYFSNTFEPFTSASGGGGGSPTGPITGYEGLCLDDRSASTANFNPIQVYTCNGTNAQQWTVESNNTLEVLGKCLDVDAAGTTNGTTVDLYTCNGTGAQTWVAQSNGSLVNPNSGKCLDDTGFGGSGTQAQIWSCTGGTNQQWTLP